MTRLGLVDYGMGNLHSVQRAFERLAVEVVPIAGGRDTDQTLESCTALVLPGVGAFDPAMERLEVTGLAGLLQAWCAAGRPLLGICLGLQLLFEASEEGSRRGLGLLGGQVRGLPRHSGQPIPHMGWEPLIPAQASPLLPAHEPPTWVYFVHSFAAVPSDDAVVTARVNFGGEPVTAAVWNGQIGACQFHPEKSSHHGEAILRRWLSWLERQGHQP
jgi:glutamine amidotransferase